jgi:hypothetical protein
MAEYSKKREVPRISIIGRPTTRARATLDVQICDLSLKGARIEHLSLLRPGSTCTLELPPPYGGMVLAAQVVWSRVIGTQEGHPGERHLRYQTGIRFAQITKEQQAVLGSALEKIIPAGGLDLARLFL